MTPSGEVGASVSAIEIVFSDANALWEATVTDTGNYALIGSGGDSTFGDGNETDLSGQFGTITYVAGTQTATVSLSAALGEEAYQFTIDGTAAVRDAAGNALGDGADEVVLFTVDAAAPNVDVDLQPGSDTGSSHTDNITRDTTPTYDVTVSEAGTIEIDWENDGTVDVTQVVGAGGTYQYTPGSALADGTYPVAVTFTDTASNEATDTDATTIDTQAPSTPGAVDLQAASDTGVSTTDNTTSAASPIFDVASTDAYFRFCRDGAQISADYDSGATYTATAEPAGTWTYTVTGVDAAGNVSDPSSGLGVTIDRTAPDAPNAPDLQAASDTGLSNTDNLTHDATPTLDLSGFGTYYRLERDGAQISADYATSAAYIDGALADGSYAYVLYAVDAAGNVLGGSSTLDMTVDTAGPTVTTLTPSGTVGASVSAIEIVFSDANALWEATVTDTGNYALIRSGGDATFADGNETDLSGQINTISYVAGTQTATVSLSAALGEEAYRFTIAGTATVRDAAGNALGDGADEVVLFTVDAAASTVTVYLQAASDTGVSDTDNLTSDTTPTYDVTVNEAGTIEIDWDDDGTVDVTQVVGAGGTYQYTPGSALADGTYPVEVTFTDTASNVATDTDATTVDTAGPTVTTVTPSGEVGAAVWDIEIVFSDANALWEATVTDTGNYALIGSGGDSTFGDGNETDLSGQFGTITYVAGTQTATVSLSAALGEEAYQFTIDGTAAVRDAAGNALGDGADEVVLFTVDAAAPNVDVDLQPGSDTGSSHTDNITRDTTPTYDVTVSEAGTIRIDWDDDGAVDATVVVGAAGTYAATPDSALADGHYPVAVTFTDTAANLAADTDPTTIDTWVPPSSELSPTQLAWIVYQGEQALQASQARGLVALDIRQANALVVSPHAVSVRMSEMDLASIMLAEWSTEQSSIPTQACMLTPHVNHRSLADRIDRMLGALVGLPTGISTDVLLSRLAKAPMSVTGLAKDMLPALAVDVAKTMAMGVGGIYQSTAQAAEALLPWLIAPEDSGAPSSGLPETAPEGMEPDTQDQPAAAPSASPPAPHADDAQA